MGKPRHRVKVEFRRRGGTEECQKSFEYVERRIIANAYTRGEPLLQNHLMCDTFKTGIGAVLLQLPDTEPGTPLRKQELRVIRFVSQRLSDAEQKYLNTEREALAVLRGLEGCHSLIVQSPVRVMVYVEYLVLLSVLKGE